MASTGPIQPDGTILADHFIQKADGSATPSDDEGLVPCLEADGKLATRYLRPVIGGDGSDGALTISSGTTTIDLGGASVYVLQYTSLSITGTGQLAFSNPSSNGTIVVIKVQEGATITSTATPAIDLVGIGAAVGSLPTNAPNVTLASSGYITAGEAYPSIYTTSYDQTLFSKSLSLTVGSAGANGETGAGTGGGAGGRGGGALYMEVAGAYNCTGIIDASGEDGSNGGDGAATNEGSGGGGGGSAGQIVILYGELTTDSGTYTMTGGNGGNGGSSGGTGGTGGSGGGGAGSIEANGGDGGSSVDTPPQSNGDAGSTGSGGGGGGGHRTSAGPGGTGGAGGSTRSAVIGVYAL